MMRLPHFTFHSPRTVREAAELLAAAPPGDAMIVAGGTDLLPNMKRRQQVPPTLIGLRRIAELRSLVLRQAQDERKRFAHFAAPIDESSLAAASRSRLNRGGADKTER